MSTMTDPQMYSELSHGKRALELSRARSEISSFIFSEPEMTTTPQGALTRSEAQERLALAERYARPKVKEWFDRRGGDLEILVSTSAGQSRLDFCKMLAGDFIPEEA